MTAERIGRFLAHHWQRYRTGAIDQRILGAGLVLATLSIAAKAVGLVREAVSASLFGTGDQIDAFVIAALVPVALTGTLCGAFQFAFIPAYRRALDRGGEEEGAQLLAAAAAVALALLGAATLAMLLAMPSYLPLVASGFGPEKRLLTERLLLALAPYVLLNGIGYIWAGVLVARRSFATPALVPAITPFVTIVCLALGGRSYGAMMLVAGTLAGQALETLALGLALARAGVRLRPRWPLRSRPAPALAALGREYGAMLAASLIMGGSLIIDQAMAASLDAGSVAAIGYASKLVSAVLHLATLALGSAVAPFYASLAETDAPGLGRRMRRHLLWVLGMSLPATLLLIALSEPLARLMFERGAFTPADTARVAWIQAAYFAQLPAFAAGVLLVRLAAALAEARLILAMAALSLTAKLALNTALMPSWGAFGIATATLPTAALSAGFLYWCLARRPALARPAAEDGARQEPG
jgi:putative peptidoglycan lipid II flippase